MKIVKYTVDIDALYEALNNLDVKPASKSYLAIKALNDIRASICPVRYLQDAFDAFATSTILIYQADETSTFEKTLFNAARAGIAQYLGFLCESYATALTTLANREAVRFLTEIIAPPKTPKELLGTISNVVKAVGV